jgi:hypothetical protein
MKKENKERKIFEPSKEQETQLLLLLVNLPLQRIEVVKAQVEGISFSVRIRVVSACQIMKKCKRHIINFDIMH